MSRSSTPQAKCHDRARVATRVRSVAGLLLILIGLLGLLVPVMPGVPLLMAGVAILGRDHHLVRPVLDRLRRIRERWRRPRTHRRANPIDA